MSAAADTDLQPADAADAGDLTRFQLETLYVLAANGPTYGLGIKGYLAEVYGEEPNHGRLYPNLDDLIEAGLVAKRALDDRTNEYSLTDDGKELLRRDAQRRFQIADGMGGQS